MVVYGRTSRLRRSYYVRSLALGPALAKETRVFGLADWLVERYRQGWLTEMREVWRARQRGLVGLAASRSASSRVVETLALVLIARDSVDGAIELGATVALAQAVLGSAVLGSYQDDNWGLSECGHSLDALEAVEVDAGAPRRPERRLARAGRDAGALDPLRAGRLQLPGPVAAGVRRRSTSRSRRAARSRSSARTAAARRR